MLPEPHCVFSFNFWPHSVLERSRDRPSRGRTLQRLSGAQITHMEAWQMGRRIDANDTRNHPTRILCPSRQFISVVREGKMEKEN